jgi:HYDIN/CFA65/VesB family protein
MSIDVQPRRLSFSQVPNGGAPTQTLLIFNRGDAPLDLREPITSAPFSVTLSGRRIPPGGFTTAAVSFESACERTEYSGSITIRSNDTERPALEVPITARTASQFNDASVSSTTSLLVHPGSINSSDEFLQYNCAIEVPAIGPTRKWGELRLGIRSTPPEGAVGDRLPQDVSIRFSDVSVPLGLTEYRSLTIRIPRGTAAPEVGYWFQVIGTALLEQENFLVFSPWVLIPQRLLQTQGGPVLKACDCPPDTPPAALFKINERLLVFPDPGPPEGMTPGQHPVAEVRAILEGPPIGVCCKNASFRLTLIVTSKLGDANNGLTSFFLSNGRCGQGGFGISADTNGVPQPVTPGPGNEVDCNNIPSDLDAIGVSVVQTQCVVPITCAGGDCVCSVPRNSYKTTLELKGPEVGSIEVFWRVSIGGTNCVVSNRATSIDNILFLRGTPPNQTVYSPRGDEFLPTNGDEDGDGSSNYAEVKAGTDPRDPNWKP